MRILYISSVSYGWHKQRPQFVCEELSKHYDICYTSFTPIGKKKFKGSHKPEHLKVKDLYVLPLSLKSGIIRFLNKILINLILKIKKYDKVIVTHPLFVSYLPENISVIYECMDNMTAFYEDKIKAFIGDCEKKLCLKSEKIIVSSEKLRINLIRDYNIDEEKITVVNNALDKNFTKSTAGTSLNTPNMVYVGTVDKWFDFETVEYFCNIHPEVSVYIVGKANCDINNAPSNMVFAGKVEHEKVFSYIKAADIVIMPFKVNELIECVDPVKMY